MNVIEKVFGTHSERELKRILPIVDKIESLRDDMMALTDEQLKDKTKEYKTRLAQGETLDDLLPEAYATVREAGRRVLNMEHFRVQLIGGIILHQGRIAEMKTGEGKTLVSTLPAYLNALEGKGVHVVTVNDYLAARDAEWMGAIHEFLGLKVGIVLNSMKPEERKAALVLSRSIFAGKKLAESGETDAQKLVDTMKSIIASEPLAKIDYVKVVDLMTMQQIPKLDRRFLAAMAVYIGKTRLIDNFMMNAGGTAE
mgnify:CR=1 FL=1